MVLARWLPERLIRQVDTPALVEPTSAQRINESSEDSVPSATAQEFATLHRHRTCNGTSAASGVTNWWSRSQDSCSDLAWWEQEPALLQDQR